MSSNSHFTTVPRQDGQEGRGRQEHNISLVHSVHSLLLVHIDVSGTSHVTECGFSAAANIRQKVLFRMHLSPKLLYLYVATYK